MNNKIKKFVGLLKHKIMSSQEFIKIRKEELSNSRLMQIMEKKFPIISPSEQRKIATNYITNMVSSGQKYTDAKRNIKDFVNSEDFKKFYDEESEKTRVTELKEIMEKHREEIDASSVKLLKHVDERKEVLNVISAVIGVNAIEDCREDKTSRKGAIYKLTRDIGFRVRYTRKDEIIYPFCCCYPEGVLEGYCFTKEECVKIIAFINQSILDRLFD